MIDKKSIEKALSVKVNALNRLLKELTFRDLEFEKAQDHLLEIKSMMRKAENHVAEAIATRKNVQDSIESRSKELEIWLEKNSAAHEDIINQMPDEYEAAHALLRKAANICPVAPEKGKCQLDLVDIANEETDLE